MEASLFEKNTYKVAKPLMCCFMTCRIKIKLQASRSIIISNKNLGIIITIIKFFIVCIYNSLNTAANSNQLSTKENLQ